MPIAPKRFDKREQIRGTKQQRGYGGEWERISRLKRSINPVCEYCNDNPADDVDHIEPFRSLDDPLRTEWTNLKSTCRQCHQAKTMAQNVPIE